MKNRFQEEPVMVLEIVQAALALIVGFGIGLSGEQVALIMAFSATVVGFLTRQRVTPLARPNLSDGHVPGDEHSTEIV